MAKNNITQWSATATSNTDVGGIEIEGENVVANFDDALREIMKQIADLNTGASFIHDTYKIADSDAETKLAKFDAGSITAGQTRTFTFPDADGTFALANDVLALSGGTLTGFVTLHAAPTADLHAASKKYVDDNSANTADPVFTGDAEFENISDGATAVDAGYVVNGSAKAFSNFDSTGTLTARKSLNVSSFIDDGVGAHRVNFTSDMNDADYGELGCTAGSGPSNGDHSFVPFNSGTGGTTSQSKQLTPSSHAGTRTDSLHLMYFVFGDLAT